MSGDINGAASEEIQVYDKALFDFMENRLTVIDGQLSIEPARLIKELTGIVDRKRPLPSTPSERKEIAARLLLDGVARMVKKLMAEATDE